MSIASQSTKKNGGNSNGNSKPEFRYTYTDRDAEVREGEERSNGWSEATAKARYRLSI